MGGGEGVVRPAAEGEDTVPHPHDGRVRPALAH